MTEMDNNSNRWADLTHTINEQTRNFRNLPGCKFETIWDYHMCTSETKFRVHKISMNAGLGTHIDAPMHCFANGASVAEILPCPKVEGVILDFEKLCIGKNIFAITKKDLLGKVEKMHLENFQDRFIVFKTGWGRFWGTDKYHNDYKCPHITEDTAQFLADNNIKGIGIDTFSPDEATPEGKYIAHEIFLSRGIWIIENVANLEGFSDTEGAFMISPLKIESSEAPVRLHFLQKR